MKHLLKFNESKSERRNVVRQIVKDIIQIFKTGKPGEYNLPEDGEYEFDNLESSFNIDLEIIKNNKIGNFKVDGGFYVDDDVMEISITYNPNAFPEETYNLVENLNELVRHELQHLIQYERGDDQTENNRNREKYYSSPHEIDAQVAGFKRVAKLKKVPFEQIVKEWFEKNKSTHRLNDKAVQRVMKKILDYKGGKIFENFNKSEFTFAEILQDLRDDYQITFHTDSTKQRDWNNIDACIKDTDATHDLFMDMVVYPTDSAFIGTKTISENGLNYTLTIKNKNDSRSYEEMYDQIEEVVDRFEEKNMYVYSVFFDGSRKYVALPKPEEKYHHNIIGKWHPSSIQIEFRSSKRNLKPTTKFGKFIDRFRNKSQTKYSSYTDDT